MLIAKKIRLRPTPEQEMLFRKSAGVSRWAYNYFLSENNRVYQEYLANGETGKKSISEGKVRKYINNVLKKTTHTWLSEIGSNVMKQAVKDANNALQRYFKGVSEKPCYKSKHKSKLSFYVNYESLSRRNGGFHGEKIGFVKTSESLPKLSKGEKYSNPHISFDGKYWYLSVGYEIFNVESELTGESIGIDLGVKEFAVCSDGKTYQNINKSKKVRRLKKKLKREQRKLSRKLKNNTKNYEIINGYRHPVYIKPLHECRNIQKQKSKIKLIYRKLTNIRNNHLHQATTEIVKTKPSRIVMETLNVKGMMKNRHLASSIQEQKFYEFKRQIEYKCQRYGIELLNVPTFYPSSKLCSQCGNIKKDLKLSDRAYHCDCCGLVIDRDYNASLNLANYQSA